jgi:hypothetical protein
MRSVSAAYTRASRGGISLRRDLRLVYRQTVRRFMSIIATLFLVACSSEQPTVEQQCARARDRLTD